MRYRTLNEIMRDLEIEVTKRQTDCEVVLEHPEYYMVLEYFNAMQRYSHPEPYGIYDASFTDIHFYTGYGMITIKLAGKGECRVEYEDVAGFFGFSKIGTEIAV